MWSVAPAEFVAHLRSVGLRRACLVRNPATGIVEPSHASLAPLAEALQGDALDYRDHEGVFMQVAEFGDAAPPLLMGAFVHKTVRGQAAGGVRLWSYASMGEYLRDGMRLSLGMGRKNAAAGLWWGGGKGVVSRTSLGDEFGSNVELRQSLFRQYGEFLSTLGGCYVTAEDAGVTVADMKNVFATTRHTTCIPPVLGGSGNPSYPTALGVVHAIKAAASHVGMGSLEGKTFAIQGAGNVGTFIVAELLSLGAKHVAVADISRAQVDTMLAYVKSKNLPVDRIDARVVPAGDNSILAADADVVSPCALGGTLNSDTIPKIRARIVCGAANNQLRDDRPGGDGTLFPSNVTYVPDFVANRMGIVNCADEAAGWLGLDDPAIQRHFMPEWESSICNVVRQVLHTADRDNAATNEVANQLADAASDIPHPIWGHRVQSIVQKANQTFRDA